MDSASREPQALAHCSFVLTPPMADTIVHGRRVVPEAALALGYQFRFPTLDAALRDLVAPHF